MSGVKERSGGNRSGAGNKPSEARMLGLIGGKAGEAVSLPAPAEIARPEGLEPEVAVIWDELAPHAIQARTLVAKTVPAFVRLCKTVVRHAELEAQIEKDGLTFIKTSVDGAGVEHAEIKAHPLITRASTCENLIRGWFKDFNIHPFGKPVIEAKAAPADPFAKFKQAG